MSMSDPFARVAQSVLSRLGQDAFLRSTVACRVPIERGVEIVGQYGEVVALRTVATLDKALVPASGDALSLVDSGEDYTLDALLADNGYTVRYTLLEA